MKTLSLILGLLLAPSVLAYVSYDGYKAFKTIPKNADEISFLHEAAKSPVHFDIWKDSNRPGGNMDIMVDPENIEFFEMLIRSRGIEYEVLMEDVGAVINAQMEVINRRKANGPELYHDYTVYHDLAGMNTWLDEFEANFSSVVTPFVVGTSYEGRTIRGVKISTGGTGKPAVYLDSNIHAREWIAGASTTYFIGKLLTNFDNGDSQIVDLLNSIDIHFVPIFNVDGYEFSHTDDRMWRKTRSPNPGSACVGTDPNRNWDFFHCDRGSSNSPCSDSYCGTEPWSEVEVLGGRDYLLTIDNLRLFMAFHSYGGWYMSPWAHYTTEPPNHGEVITFCERGVNALNAVNGQNFECGTIQSFVGATSGSSVDWVYDFLGCKYNFGPELRGPSFILDEDQIVPSGEENYAAFIQLLIALKDEFAP